MKVARLIYVEVNDGKTNQSNKFYNMSESGSNILVEYGRVGCDNPQKKTYSIYDWDKLHNSKIKKGYKDVTHLRAENTIIRSIKNTSKEVEQFFNLIQSYSSNSVKINYILSSKEVTPQMIIEAQRLIDNLMNIPRNDLSKINNALLELYKIIPRKMRDVRNHLADTNWKKEQIDKLIASEQDTLDSMAGQVSAQNVDPDGSDDLLEALGLNICYVDDTKIIDMAKKMMGDKYRHFNRMFEVLNKKTEDKYNLFKERVSNENLLWHGSRNQNWFNILQTGLLIRPSGAVLTGAMFGNSVYFANQCRKALNYTSLQGSYWAGGNDRTAFMALFNTKLGKQKHIHKHDYTCNSLNWEKVNKEGCDSVYAHGGYDLINDEFCVYRTDQTTIKYVVELKA